MVTRAAPTICSHTLKMVQQIYTAINQCLDAADSMKFQLSHATIQSHLECYQNNFPVTFRAKFE